MSTISTTFHAFRTYLEMDETCATESGGRSPCKITAPVTDHTNMFKSAGADILNTSGVEVSTLCAGNKTTRYHMLHIQVPWF